MKIEELKDKKILILGFGREGKDTFRFLRKIFPRKEIAISDKNPSVKIKNLKKTKWFLGEDYLKPLKNYEVIIKSPGIPFSIKEVKEALEQGKITTQTEIFFDNFKGKIIGITGTKGKSTTSKLIFEILKTAGFKVFLGGNIKVPVLKYIFKDGYFIYELSSHQLFNLKKSPHISVLLDIFEDHLDYYKSFKEYILAKANIAKYQKPQDFLIFSSENKICKKIVKYSLAKKIPIKKDLNTIKSLGLKITPQFKIYSLNLQAAISVAKILNIKKEIIKKAILNFKFLPHRMEFLGNFKGVDFYNDSMATNPDSTIFAIRSLKEKLETLILGGLSKKLEEKKLVKEILKSKIKNLVLLPETGISIYFQVFKKRKNLDLFLTTKLKEGVKFSFLKTSKGGTVLFSPGAASFNLFENAEKRGEEFKKMVKFYGKP